MCENQGLEAQVVVEAEAEEAPENGEAEAKAQGLLRTSMPESR